MNLIIVDFSTGKFRNISEKELSSCLIKIKPRIFIGDLPARSIKALIVRFKSVTTKKTNLIILIKSSDGYHGWKCFQIGSKNGDFDRFESEISGITD